MPKILVVDDEPNIRTLISQILLLEGYEVVCASDGHNALEAIDLYTPDCVILDVMMPRLDGHEVLKRIRAVETGHLPVVMLTAAADDAQQWQSWTEGVDYFLAKPFDASELLRYLGYLFSGATASVGSWR